MKIRQIVAGVVLALGVQGAVMANSMPTPAVEQDIVAYAFDGVEAQQLSALSGTEMAETQGAFFGMMMGMMNSGMNMMMQTPMGGMMQQGMGMMMQSPMGPMIQQGMGMMMQSPMGPMAQQMMGMMPTAMQQMAQGMMPPPPPAAPAAPYRRR